MTPANETTCKLGGGPETRPEVQSPGAVCPDSPEPPYGRQTEEATRTTILHPVEAAVK